MPELPEPDYMTSEAIKKHGKTAIIVDAGGHREIKTDKGPKMKPWVLVEFVKDHTRKTFDLNKTTQENLRKAFGSSNTDSWVGKQIELSVIPQVVGGRLTDVILAGPVVEGVRVNGE